jgi:hypothetical protein
VKKPEGRKSRETVPLSVQTRHSDLTECNRFTFCICVILQNQLSGWTKSFNDIFLSEEILEAQHF